MWVNTSKYSFPQIFTQKDSPSISKPGSQPHIALFLATNVRRKISGHLRKETYPLTKNEKEILKTQKKH